MCYPLLNSHKVKGLSKCLCPSPPWAYKIIHLLLLPMWFFFQLVNCYNDNLDKVGFNTNVTIRTVKRLLMFRTEFWTFETKKKKQNKNKSLPLEFQITGMENLHRKSKDADFHLQFLWRQSLDPSLLCVWSSRTNSFLNSRRNWPRKVHAERDDSIGYFFISNWYDRSYQVLYFTYCIFYEYLMKGNRSSFSKLFKMPYLKSLRNS